MSSVVEDLITKVADDRKCLPEAIRMLMDVQIKRYGKITDFEALYRVAKNLGSKEVLKLFGNNNKIRVIHCKHCDGSTFKVIELEDFFNDMFMGIRQEIVCEECREVYKG